MRKSRLKPWTPAYAVGQVVRSLVHKTANVRTVVAVDDWGYELTRDDGSKDYLHEWELAPMTPEEVAARLHRTRTTTPEGWHRSELNVGRDRHGGQVYNGVSTAVCSCGWTSIQESREAARRAAREHKQASVAP